jgi:hypothetical protein
MMRSPFHGGGHAFAWFHRDLQLFLTEQEAATISAIEVDADGRLTRIRLWDKNAALDKAMKRLGLYNRHNTQQSENRRLQVLLVWAPTNERV